MVARRVQELGAGVPLPAPTPAAIHQALSLVLADPPFSTAPSTSLKGSAPPAGYRRGADKILEAAMGSAPCAEHLSGGAERKTAA